MPHAPIIMLPIFIANLLHSAYEAEKFIDA